MTTLTETAFFTRKIINIGAIVLVAVIILRIVIGITGDIWRTLFPPPPPAATLAFGKLPYPSAQNSISSPSGIINFTLETADGGLPAMPRLATVYFMPRPGPSFGSFDRMKTAAGKMNFTDVPKKVSGTAWRFVDPATPLRILDIDEVSGNFHLTYNFLSDLSLFNDKNFSSQDQVVSNAKSFLSGLGLLPDDLGTKTPTVSYFRLDSGALVGTTSLSNADAVGVTFNRSDVEKIPVVSPDAKQGLVSVLYSGSNDQKKKILEVRYFYTPVDLENSATYPLAQSGALFEKLKAGQAIYASLPNPPSNSITIRNVYLAYLDPYPPQSYLQPVLVFSDEKGFVAYVPAISSDWLGQ